MAIRVGSAQRSRRDGVRHRAHATRCAPALTVLGVVIGITSIVGMTAMIRGFDQSLRDMIRAIGPNTIFVQRFGVTSFASGAEITRAAEAAEPDDLRRARDRGAGDDAFSSSTSSSAPGGPPTQQRVFYRDQKTKPLVVFGTTENFAEGTRIPIARRPVLQRHRSAVPQERRRARQHAVSGAVRPIGTDPIGKIVRVGSRALRGRRRVRQAAGGRRLQPRPGRLRRHPVHGVPAHLRPAAAVRVGAATRHVRADSDRGACRATASTQADAIADVERVMRIRHGLQARRAERLRHR